MDSSGLIKIAAIGGVGYLAYNWWQSQQTSSASGATGSTAAGGTGAGASTPPVNPANPPTASIYNGPSLDQMYSQLVAAALAGMSGGDTAVTCGDGMSGYRGMGRYRGLGAGGRSTNAAVPVDVSDPTAAVSPSPLRGAVGRPIGANRVTGGGSVLGGSTAQSSTPAACSTPLATPDVWNWYLVNRTQAGVSSAPDPSVAFPGADLSAPITGAQYWAGVSPLISSSLGMSGLGVFGVSFRRSGLGLFVGKRSRRAGFGDAPVSGTPAAAAAYANSLGPPTIDASGNLVTTSDATIAANLAALQASAAQGGADTNAGSYSVDPTTGAVVFTPATSVSLIPGVSNGVLALGVGAGLFIFAVAAGGRR